MGVTIINMIMILSTEYSVKLGLSVRFMRNQDAKRILFQKIAELGLMDAMNALLRKEN